MEQYISQLIEDILSAHRAEQNVKPTPQEETFESHIRFKTTSAYT